jgi:hypothetical protein
MSNKRTDKYLANLGREPLGPKLAAEQRRQREAAAAAPPTPAPAASDGDTAAATAQPGILMSYTIVFVLLFCVRLALHYVPNGKVAAYGFFGFVVVVFAFRTLRRAFLVTLALVTLVCLTASAIKHHDSPMPSRMRNKLIVRDAARLAVNFGPGKQLFGIVTDRLETHAKIIAHQRQASEGKIDWTAQIYSPYYSKIDGRDPAIRQRAIELTRPCPEGDALCEISMLHRYVSQEVHYTSDPRGDGDYIQPPQQTMQSMGGDCEDQSILLSSLLEGAGKRTLIAITPRHAFPMVCLSGDLQARYREARARARSDRGYAKLVMGPGGIRSSPTLTQLYAAAGPDGDTQTCLALEPTSQDSCLGEANGGDAGGEIKAVLDPDTKSAVPLRASRVLL